MPRIPYPDLSADPAARKASESVCQARDGEVLNLYRMLLHEPPLATSWSQLGSQLRYRGLLDDRTRELVICRVATRTNSAYELHHHGKLALRTGVTREQIEALDAPSVSDAFDLRDRRLLAFADAVLAARVDADHVRDALEHVGQAELVELAALVAYYLAVSRFLCVFDVEIERADG